jgi:hypothetical protein
MFKNTQNWKSANLTSNEFSIAQQEIIRSMLPDNIKIEFD